MLKFLLFSTLAVLTTAVLYSDFRPDTPKYHNPENLLDSYDFIIVGSGSAGGVVASRLSENPNVKVLLLEAGPHPPAHSHIPGYFAFTQNTEMDWQYRTEPQKKACKSMVEQRSAWPRGKALGGSTSHNFMQWNRGHVTDYEYWEELGNKGWGWKDVLPYFSKSESVMMPELKNSEDRGHSGPIHITWTRRTNFTDLYLEAAEKAGYYISPDHNDEQKASFARAQQFVSRTGRRQSTIECYILRVLADRPNLHILPNALVTKVLTEGGRRATGVEFAPNNNRDPKTWRKVKVNGDVILSGGAVNSPQLLMLSGIGPKSHLDEIGIPLVKDLPSVGQNLRDHYQTDLTFLTDQTVGIDHLSLQNTLGYSRALMEYDLHGTSALNGSAITVNGELYSGFNQGDKRPDLQIIVFDRVAMMDLSPEAINLTPEADEKAYGRARKIPGISYLSELAHPYSVGEIKLKSNDPFEHPHIDPKYLDDERDVETMLAGVKVALNIAEQEPLKRFGFRFGEEPVPGCEKHKFMSDDYFRCHIRHRTLTIYHPVCSNHMGTDPKTSVLDQQLRVHGFENLRVIDASAFPSDTSGNTNSPSIMVGEKGADLIKLAYRKTLFGPDNGKLKDWCKKNGVTVCKELSKDEL